MPVRIRPVEVRIRRGRQLVASICREIEDARVDRGLSYAALGRALGISGQQAARICQGRSPRVAIARLTELCALVGLDLAARTFPGGQPLRDGAQQALLGRLRLRIGAATRWCDEVPVVAAAAAGARPDRRAWDAVISGQGWQAAVEAETNVRDVQALLRRLALKQRDGDVEGGVLLVLNDSRHHRELLQWHGAILREAFPIGAREALARLSRGQAPGSAIVLI